MAVSPAPARRRVRHELVDEQTERELVRTVIDRASAGLLRRHVSGSAEHDPWLGTRDASHRRTVGTGCARLRGAQLRETEVHDLREAIARHHDVLRFEIAVDDPGGMRFASPSAIWCASWIERRNGIGLALSISRSVCPSTHSIAK